MREAHIVPYESPDTRGLYIFRHSRSLYIPTLEVFMFISLVTLDPAIFLLGLMGVPTDSGSWILLEGFPQAWRRAVLLLVEAASGSGCGCGAARRGADRSLWETAFDNGDQESGLSALMFPACPA